MLVSADVLKSEITFWKHEIELDILFLVCMCVWVFLKEITPLLEAIKVELLSGAETYVHS